MVTKEQALTCKEFKYKQYYKVNGLELATESDIKAEQYKIISSKWRANGKCQTWKRSPDKFKLPIKHGLYNYSYITEENAHLFEVIK